MEDRVARAWCCAFNPYLFIKENMNCVQHSYRLSHAFTAIMFILQVPALILLATDLDEDDATAPFVFLVMSVCFFLCYYYYEWWTRKHRRSCLTDLGQQTTAAFVLGMSEALFAMFGLILLGNDGVVDYLKDDQVYPLVVIIFLSMSW